MEVRATVTSKGQVTIPVAVREALGIRRGTRILFRVEDERVLIELEGSNRQVVMETFPDFFALAGSVAVPADLRGASWKTIRRRARSDRLARIGRGTR
jgi:antitoxin PrlF